MAAIIQSVKNWLGLNPRAYTPTGPEDDYWYGPRFDLPWLSPSPLSALQISAVFACHRILSGDIARTPIQVWERVDDGRELRPRHYLNRVLTRAANPYMSARRFKALMQNWALSGNAYAYIETNARGQVVALWPWHPDKVTVKPAADWDGYVYEYRLRDGQKISQPWVNILHIRGLETDGVMGLSPIQACRRTFELALSQDEYSTAFYRNGGAPGGILSGPFPASEKEKIREEWNRAFGGPLNANKTAVLQAGTDWKPIQRISQSDAEFIATKKMGVADFSRMYGVPLHKLAELDKATFSNIEEQGLEYESSSAGDWMSNWEAELVFSCLSDREAETIFVEFDREEMRRGRFGEQMEALANGANAGLITRDEGRAKLRLNKKGGNAAKLMAQQQNVPIDELPIESAEPAAPAPPKKPTAPKK